MADIARTLLYLWALWAVAAIQGAPEAEGRQVMVRRFKINWWLLITVLILATLKAAHFGWNVWPKSRDEAVMGVICMVLFVQCFERGTR